MQYTIYWAIVGFLACLFEYVSIVSVQKNQFRVIYKLSSSNHIVYHYAFLRAFMPSIKLWRQLENLLALFPGQFLKS